MRIVYENEWNGSRQSLLDAIAVFKAEREAHKFTENVPAPVAPQIVEELVARDSDDIVLAAELPIEPPAPVVSRPELDQALTDRWILNQLAKQMAGEKDAPDYVVRHAERVNDARTEARPA